MQKTRLVQEGQHTGTLNHGPTAEGHGRAFVVWFSATFLDVVCELRLALSGDDIFH